MARFRIQFQNSGSFALTTEQLQEAQAQTKKFLEFLIKECKVHRDQLNGLRSEQSKNGVTVTLPDTFSVTQNGSKNELYYRLPRHTGSVLIASTIGGSTTHFSLENLQQALGKSVAQPQSEKTKQPSSYALASLALTSTPSITAIADDRYESNIQDSTHHSIQSEPPSPHAISDELDPNSASSAAPASITDNDNIFQHQQITLPSNEGYDSDYDFCDDAPILRR